MSAGVYSIHDLIRGKSWHIDVFLSVLLFYYLALLQPCMPDGDGLSHAARAIYQGFLEGMYPKHLIYAMVLRIVYLVVETFGLRKYTIEALSLTSGLAAIGIFLLLVRIIFAAFIKNRLVLYACAMGVILSFGVMSRASTIEAYALSLLMDVALVAVCFTVGFNKHWHGVAVGILYVVSVGLHVTNVLLVPFIVVIIIYRAGYGWVRITLMWAGMTFLLGMTILLSLLLIGKGGLLWPPALTQFLPTADVQPPLSLPGRLGRVVYGFARTIAWLEPFSDLSLAFALGYAIAMLATIAVVLYMAWHGLLRCLAKYQQLMLMLALVSLPFIAMGLYYFPSDPERWLFLLPVFWLLVGLVWSEYAPSEEALLNKSRSSILLVFMVLVLGLYNGLYKLLPETFENRQLSGLKELSMITTPMDLVITPAGITGRIYEFFLGKQLELQNITLTSLVAQYQADQNAMETYLRNTIVRELQRGRLIYVHNVINEGHIKGSDYPWAHFTEFDYGPETFIAVLREFGPSVVISTNQQHTGTYRLRLEKPHTVDSHFLGGN